MPDIRGCDVCYEESKWCVCSHIHGCVNVCVKGDQVAPIAQTGEEKNFRQKTICTYCFQKMALSGQKQSLQFYKSNPACHLFILKKKLSSCFWHTAMPILLHIVCGCLHTKIAELKSCRGNAMGHKAKNIYLALNRKSLPTPDLNR